MGAVKEGRVRDVEEILFDSTFDRWLLGRALLTSLDMTSRDDERNAYRLARLLVSKGAEIEYVGEGGRTPLMEACRKRFETVAALLLDAGASLEPVDAVGRTARDYVDQAGGDTAALSWIVERARLDREPPCRVRNLKASMRGGTVVVTYDLEAASPVPVRLTVSDDDGRTYTLNVGHVTGDVGERVAPGENRRIVWSVKKDYPQGLDASGLMLDVVVSQR
jgi:hypothetical protein